MNMEDISVSYIELIRKLTQEKDLEGLEITKSCFNAPFLSYSYHEASTRVQMAERLIQARRHNIAVSIVDSKPATKEYKSRILQRLCRKGRVNIEVASWLPMAQERQRLRRPPGSSLNALAEFVFSTKTYERVFLPTIADLQEEYMATLANRRAWKARWVWLRGHGTFWAAVLAQLPVSASRLVVRIWKAAGS